MPCTTPPPPPCPELPMDIIELILDRLGPIENLRFGAVCQSWRAARAAHRARRQPPTPQLPWLYDIGQKQFNRRFIDPSDGKHYTIPPVNSFLDYCIGTSDHWLIMLSAHVCISLYLYNPFTLAKVWLPDNGAWPEFLRIRRPVFAVTSEPSRFHFAIVVVNSDSYSFLYTVYHRRWCWHSLPIDDKKLVAVASVGKVFYALTGAMRLIRIEFEALTPFVVTMLPFVNLYSSIDYHGSNKHVCLVESDGELLAVIKTWSCRGRQHGGRRLRIRRPLKILRFDNATSLWWKLDMGRLRELVLFLGDNGSISLPAREYGLPGARVYTAGDGEFGVFDVKSEDGVGEGTVCCTCKCSNNEGYHRPMANWVKPDLFYR